MILQVSPIGTVGRCRLHLAPADSSCLYMRSKYSGLAFSFFVLPFYILHRCSH